MLERDYTVKSNTKFNLMLVFIIPTKYIVIYN